jgi:heme/copper-type cytochrome/quinol oxidase subunit 4
MNMILMCLLNSPSVSLSLSLSLSLSPFRIIFVRRYSPVGTVTLVLYAVLCCAVLKQKQKQLGCFIFLNEDEEEEEEL